MHYRFSEDFARQADAEDSLAPLRDEFIFPFHEEQPALYFTGNSLGLQARKTKTYLLEELEDWGNLGVEGHTESRRPWLHYHEFFNEALARIVGARPTETVAMGSLTTNLHLLMVSFYRPTGIRKKIMCEGKAFPSDQYALKSQLRYHGLNPDEDLIEIEPDPETGYIDEEQLLKTIDAHADELALLMIGGVNYYSGQVFNMEKITAKAQAVGAMVGWDLAHAAGNVPLQLHNWQVDFAAWCGYKYLNSGPGGVSGIFIHEKHHSQLDIPRFEGWWGHNKNTRFNMPSEFDPIPTAEAWQLSNAPVLAMAPLLASLELFDRAGMSALRQKSIALTGYLIFVLQEVRQSSGIPLKIMAPEDVNQRGCQVSLVVPNHGRAVFEKLSSHGVIADWREPDVIRLAPVPLYNSFGDVYQFAHLLEEILIELKS